MSLPNFNLTEGSPVSDGFLKKDIKIKAVRCPCTIYHTTFPIKKETMLKFFC